MTAADLAQYLKLQRLFSNAAIIAGRKPKASTPPAVAKPPRATCTSSTATCSTVQ